MATLRLLPTLTTTAVLLGLLAGCNSVEWRNADAANAIKEQAQPPGSVYTGWRVFQDKCAQCHGSNATGSASAPNLLPLVRELGPRGFTARVLQRYDWNLPVEAAQLQGQTLEHWTERVLQRQAGVVTMPAWQTEPRVNAHILDLYAYLSARADGRQGVGRPTP